MVDNVVPADILVVGGGISGISAAIEAADAGKSVVLLEKEAFLGGNAIRMNLYFPKLCPPTCGLELNFRHILNNPRIRVFTLAELESYSGTEGGFKASVRLAPRQINDNCTSCGDCANACPAERKDSFNYGWNTTKAIFLPHLQAFPHLYVVDSEACRGADCSLCVSACRYGAIDLQMTERHITIECASIITATGWQPYDATRLDRLGFGIYPNVINNMMMERLAARSELSGSPIARPSDGKPVQSVAIVQCAGSRDINHLDYCSGVCCMASLKQASYITTSNPNARASIYYIDIRAQGIHEDFYQHVLVNERISFTRGKVSRIREDAETNDLTIEVEDTAGGTVIRQKVDMAVLATGMVPAANGWLPEATGLRDRGFIPEGKDGIYAAGCAKRPMDVSSSIRDALDSALKSMRSCRRGADGK